MQNKIAIMYLDNSFTFGGAINSLLYLLRGLKREIYEPIVVTGQSDEILRAQFNDFTYYRVNLKLPWVHNQIYKKIIKCVPKEWKRIVRLINLLRFVYWFLFIILPEAFRYRQIGRKHQVKIVHLNNILGSQLAGFIAAKLLRVPCIAHQRDFEKSGLFTKVLAKQIDHHIAISSAIKENLLDLGVKEENISLVYDALDLQEFDSAISYEHLRDEFNVKRGEKTFGIFGRIVDWKGTLEFVNAAKHVLRDVPRAKAFVVGDVSDGSEEYLSEVKRAALNGGYGERIAFTGYRDDIPAMMRLMDVVVHASTSPEPFGMVIIEAMAMQKAVVASDAGGPRDIVVDGVTGILVPAGDISAMSAAILTLLENSELRIKMGAEGRRRVEGFFTKERYAREVEEVYECCLLGIQGRHRSWTSI